MRVEPTGSTFATKTSYPPAVVPAKIVDGLEGSMARDITPAEPRPALATAQLAPPSVLLNTKSPAAAYSVVDVNGSMASLCGSRPRLVFVQVRPPSTLLKTPPLTMSRPYEYIQNY